MNHVSETGVYSLGRCLTKEFIFFKDSSPAIPFKEEYFRKFFDNLDDILLDADQPKRFIGFQANYPCEDKYSMDYGHWEILLIVMLFSLIGAKIQNENAREKIREYFFCGPHLRFDWEPVNDLWHKHIANFTLHDFLQLPDEKLSSVEKAVRPVAESAWEYTNCIDLSSDEKCINTVGKLLKNAYFMVVSAPDADTSLQTAASMYGSFIKLMDTKIETLEPGWIIYE